MKMKFAAATIAFLVSSITANASDVFIEQAGSAFRPLVAGQMLSIDLIEDMRGTMAETVRAVRQDMGATGASATLLVQSGNAHVANIAQMGPGNLGIISQAGWMNSVSLNQIGRNNSAMILQSGYGNLASVTQTGSNHSALVSQQGRGNVAIISQR